MKRFIVLMVLASLICFSGGCASVASYNASKREIALERIHASGNTDAIRAVNAGISPDRALKIIPVDSGNGVDGAILAIDIGSVDAVMRHPFRQVGAAVVDAGTVYLTIEGVRYLNGDETIFGQQEGGSPGSGDVNATVNNSQNTVIITGDNNQTSTSLSSPPVVPAE